MKILFFDIDGTLLSEQTGDIPESCRQAIKKAQDNGHLCFVNTGRPIASVDDQIRSLHMDGYVCGCGSYIEYNHQTLLESSLPHDLCVEIVKKLKECKVSALLEGTNGIYYEPENRHPRIDYIKSLYAKDGFDMSKTWYDEDIFFDKVTVWMNDDSDEKGFYDYITQYLTPIKRDVGMYEFIQNQYSKATGIQFLLDHFNLSLEDAFAFGDSANDLSMLSYVKNSIAMGNSTEEVKQQVAYVTKTVEEEGIAHAMRHYGIIE